MAFRTIRNNCRKEPVKIVPMETEVTVLEIPADFPKICKKMIGKTYEAIIRKDRRGNIWYKILKSLVFGDSQDFKSILLVKDKNPDVVSFEGRKYIDLPEKYCNN